MLKLRLCCLILAAACLLGITGSALAAEVDSDTAYCFTCQDFSRKEEPLAGICITQLPEGSTGTVMLGSRMLQPGDILTAQQVEKLTFLPVRREQDGQAQLGYLPIYEKRVEKPAAMTIAIRGKEDKAPVAEDSGIETYRNLPNEGKLKASDPEGESLQFTVCRKPRRGTVELSSDGSFVYTPRKNKVGVDSFTFTATDPTGHVSREATVTVQILKPTDSKQYTDTMGNACRFEAEWLRNAGLFEGETVSGQSCFFPEKPVTRGQFLAMAVKLLDIPAETAGEVSAGTEQWLQPYLTAAMRSGLLEGVPDMQTGVFDAAAPVTEAEAAVMLQNALDLQVGDQALAAMQTDSQDEPQWAYPALTVMSEHGVEMNGGSTMTRGQAAQVLYKVSYLALEAPGTSVFRIQR